MIENFKTDQEKFWAGAFGDEYSLRNTGKKLTAGNLSFFSAVLRKTENVHSVLEFGSNIGLNLKALVQLLPDGSDFSAIEINQAAVKELEKWSDGKIRVYQQSIQDFVPDFPRDFVFTKGVLIHINPDDLQKVYGLLYESCGRYLCICEYFNPAPVSITYRGNTDRLFKRDFAGEIMKAYPDLRLVDYGFVYHGDNNFPQDDITWFLMEKTGGTARKMELNAAGRHDAGV